MQIPMQLQIAVTTLWRMTSLWPC